MALNVDLDISFDNLLGWKAIQEKAGEVNSTKSYIINHVTSLEFSPCGTSIILKMHSSHTASSH
jgi:hypothetical protein